MKPLMTHIALHVSNLDASLAFYREFCGLKVVHERVDEGARVVWLAEDGKERAFVLVFIEGGRRAPQAPDDMSHLGFALESRDAVGEIASRGRAHLVWPPRDLPYPVGYFCALRDPDGNIIEFSHGQPLGPGAEARDTAVFGARG
jgi:catechol 2,3-dioxygenase-like lactoylglutathione lyase family enzyme